MLVAGGWRSGEWMFLHRTFWEKLGQMPLCWEIERKECSPRHLLMASGPITSACVPGETDVAVISCASIMYMENMENGAAKLVLTALPQKPHM